MPRRATLSALVGLIACMPSIVAAQDDARAADLAAPVRLMAAGGPIDVGGFAAPFVGDFDEDGVDDLLVGQIDFGLLRIYRNLGTQQEPLYDTHEWFHAEGHIASVPTGCVVGFTPQLVDYDGDGRTDIMTGSFFGAQMYAFRRHEDGTFFDAEVIERSDGSVSISSIDYNSTVFACDWDADGDNDLLTGRGVYTLVRNHGTNANPRFGDAERIVADGAPIPNGYVPPCMADWDGDGRDDLIVGRGKDIVWYRNVSDASEPVFESSRLLVGQADLVAPSEIGPDESRTSPSTMLYAVCVTDYDHDGHLDLLLGDHYYADRTLSDDEQQAFALHSQKLGEFSVQYRQLVEDAVTLGSRQERVEAFRTALADWRRLNAEIFSGPQAANPNMERHGGVWFYRRLNDD